MEYTFSPSIRQRQVDLCELQARKGYMDRLCLKKNTTKENKKLTNKIKTEEEKALAKRFCMGTCACACAR